MLGTQELLLILGAGILLFGARKIPEIARGLGRSMTEFKKGMHEDDDAEKTNDKPGSAGSGDSKSGTPS